LLLLPSTARPGDTVPLTVALVDVRGNVGGAGATRVTLLEPPDGLELPEAFELPADAGGHARFEVPVRAEGVYRLRARTTAGLEAESNPLVVRADAPRLLWGDLHGHTNWSDGTGLPEDYFRYARDVAALDVVALTDHDHW